LGEQFEEIQVSGRSYTGRTDGAVGEGKENLLYGEEQVPVIYGIPCIHWGSIVSVGPTIVAEDQHIRSAAEAIHMLKEIRIVLIVAVEVGHHIALG